ncbi:protein-export chaperone SecB [Halorhodospira neutriphila]|uniref:Protein-export protein SecB n=1 Tax=Halorhodospira neutriphila TaxID=168379 RepID=A0ABS1E9Q4_9GAMM|nr:protein-export chaperone SecB [Halorhodospira neutriphila]MBK1727409.1 protein-export chaperone SecB [Halorhodospira neutriphila]
MAEGNGSNESAAQGQGGQQFQIAKVYLRDVSFEAPEAPGIFQSEWRPQIDVELGTASAQMGEGTFDVVLTITVTAKVNEQTAYLCEVRQGGVFRMEGFDEAQIEHLLGAYCPAQLFPFAREAINDLVVKGGFPQLLLAPVNFEALYLQQRERAGEGAEAADQGH